MVRGFPRRSSPVAKARPQGRGPVGPTREQFFALGIALGTALGFILGSLFAFRIGEQGMDSMRRIVERVLGHEEGPKFEVLLQ